MNIIESGKSTLDAQLDHLKFMGLRVGQQGLYCVIALVFGVFALFSFHAVIWAVLVGPVYLPAWVSALIVLAIDIAGIIVFVLLAYGKEQSEAETLALAKRDHAIQEFKESLAFTAVLGATAGPVGKFVLKWVFELLVKKIKGKSKK